jgi:acyl-coenzyme A thioesterase PaaI-like protein
MTTRRNELQHSVKRKQPNSKMCLVCGLKNPYGLRASFLELDNDELVGLFTPLEEHQSYPGRLHGGVAAALLDETIGRAILCKYDETVWGVTVEFNIRYRKPIPIRGDLKVLGRITAETTRTFEGTGEILLPDGQVAVEGKGKYIKLPLNRIADFDFNEQEWKIVPSERDPKTVEL